MARLFALLLLVPGLAFAAPAVHHGVIDGSSVQWDSYGVTNQRGEVRLAHPISTEELSAWDSSGRPLELEVDDEGRVSVLRTGYPFEQVHLQWRDALVEGELHPPLLAQPDLQRVSLDGGRFSPAPSVGLVRRLRSWGPPSLSLTEQHHVDRYSRKHARGLPHHPDGIYLSASHLSSRGSLPGDLRVGSAVSPHAATWGALALGLLLLGGFGAYRGLERAAQRERNTWYIENELGPGSGAP